MATLLLSHPLCALHDMPGSPETPDRLAAIERALAGEAFAALRREPCPAAGLDRIALAHPMSYVEMVRNKTPEEGYFRLDPDTTLSPASFEAALRAAGGAVRAVDAVAAGEATNAFCAVRPPGHHAERKRAMGFCIFNNAAIAALHARDAHGMARVAVVDFDVHHGNGTQSIFWADRDLFYGSTHQMPLYPGTGRISETGEGNIFNAPLPPGAGSAEFKEAFNEQLLRALVEFGPELIVVSAGFDAHEADPLASLNLTTADFRWASERLVDIADEICGGRLVSVLEGGYDLEALGQSVAAHVEVLMEAGL
jgi:acetoin utilization deacetylase AcuC-like enzyme